MPKLTGDDEKRALILRATHDDYASEALWHRFLLDAYAGTGGFAGRVRLPFASFWGSAAEDYGTALSTTVQGDLNDSESQIDTYLERFPREDVRKFSRRVAVSDYHNYCEPIVDVRHSYLNRKPMTYEGVDALRAGDDSWWRQVGEGMTWDELMTQRVRLRALVLGWVPVLVDVPRLPENVSVAQAREMKARARLIPLFPSNMLSWSYNAESGRLDWAKLRVCYTEQLGPMAPKTKVERFQLWSATEVQEWELRTDDQGNESLSGGGTVRHPFEEVPLVIFRAKPSPADRLRGLSIINSVARMNRKLFNYVSEFDEHLRSCVFGMLQVPTADPKNPGTIVGGNGNVLYLDHKSGRDFKWISPDGGVAQTYEPRIEKQVEEIHRVGRAQSGSGKQVAKSGVAQAYDFEGLNRAISDNAQSLAVAEQQVLRLVCKVEDPSAKLTDVRVIAASKFDVEEMAKDLEEALTAVDLNLGVTATARMKQRLVRKLLPNLSEDDLALIDDEIEEAAVRAEQEAAATREMLTQDPNDPTDPPDPTDDPAVGKTPPPREPPKGPPVPGERTKRPGTPRAKGPRG